MGTVQVFNNQKYFNFEEDEDEDDEDEATDPLIWLEKFCKLCFTGFFCIIFDGVVEGLWFCLFQAKRLYFNLDI